MILLDLSRTCYTSTQHPPMAHHVTQSKNQSPYNGQHLLALPPPSPTTHPFAISTPATLTSSNKPGLVHPYLAATLPRHPLSSFNSLLKRHLLTDTATCFEHPTTLLVPFVLLYFSPTALITFQHIR